MKRNFMIFYSIFLVVFLIGLPNVAGAFGIDDEMAVTLSSWAFRGHNAVDDASFNHTGNLGWCNSSNCNFRANFTLPSGAILTRIELDAYDMDDIQSMGARYVGCAIGASSCAAVGNTAWTSYGGSQQVTATVNTTISNDNFHVIQVWMETFLSSPGSSLSFRGVRVFYKLQIAPAPDIAAFNDVELSHWSHQYVAALADSGITVGYGDGTFRPDNYVTRAQMAAFLARALGLHYSP